MQAAGDLVREVREYLASGASSSFLSRSPEEGSYRPVRPTRHTVTNIEIEVRKEDAVRSVITLGQSDAKEEHHEG